ncbi:hypothetical protein ACFL2F_02395, partial [Myxococcota bacterium]
MKKEAIEKLGILVGKALPLHVLGQLQDLFEFFSGPVLGAQQVFSLEVHVVSSSYPVDRNGPQMITFWAYRVKVIDNHYRTASAGGV